MLWKDFMVCFQFLESNEEFFCTQVSFEHKWWKEKQKNTEQFYDKYIIYELAYPRLRDGLQWLYVHV